MGGKEYMERKIAIKKEEKLPLIEKEPKSNVGELKGIIPRAFNQIMTVTRSQIDKKHLITCSFL